MSTMIVRCIQIGALIASLAACHTAPPLAPASSPPPVSVPTPPPVVAPRPVRIGIALGGGAARGFAHIGVLKVLEAQGLAPEIVAGTSAGSLVGSLYASGLSGIELQQIALRMDESVFADWQLGGRGMFRGEALMHWVDDTVHGRTIEQMRKPLGITATDLATGEPVLFQRGDTGVAVRASSAVPGVFAPVSIRGHEYVDGGLVSPVPVRAARRMGADLVIAVDISADPRVQPTQTVSDLLLQTFAIMGRSINRFELSEADVVIHPKLASSGTDFAARHVAVLAGEEAALAALPEIRAKLEALRQSQGQTGAPMPAAPRTP